MDANDGKSGIPLPNPVVNYYEKKKQVKEFVVPDGYDERIKVNKKRGRGRPRKYPRADDVLE